MTNKEAREAWKKLYSEIDKDNWLFVGTINPEMVALVIKALERDKCSSCKHYDKDYGETCLNPEGTCRVFEYDGYEEAENDTSLS